MAKLLIVEDEPLVARMYQKTLAFDDFEVEIAVGGNEGLQKVKTYKPDLVLLDIMMPEPDGMEVLGRILADPETKNIPVVVLTNLAGSQDTKMALTKGAVAYWVKKETQPEKLGKKIKTILAKKGQTVEEPKAEEKANESERK